MGLKLYYATATRSTRPRWLLEELGVPYEMVRLDPSKQENRSPEYLGLNPGGHVPTLVDGDRAIFESLAIILYLADKFPEKGLAPLPSDPDRAAYLQWSVFAMVTLEKEVDAWSKHTRRLPEPERIPAAAELARRTFLREVETVEAALEGKEFLVGGRFTAADVVMASVLGWAKVLGLIEERPRLLDYVRPLVSRPAAKASRAD